MEVCLEAFLAGAADGHVVVARRQTAGRGRTGRAWHSSDEGGLYLSLLLRGFTEPPAGLTLAAGLGVGEAVRRLGAPDVRLKWPNDVLLGERKAAGILTQWIAGGGAEVNGGGGAIVGVGLNVAQRTFPPDLVALATSIALETGRTPTLAAALDALLDALDEAVDAFRRGGLAWAVPEWSARSGLWGRRARTAGVEGTMERLEADGSLVVRTDAGESTIVTAGAVELL
jgi:BirA family biotin operon repressor/biotin-[acetyl-CoA-carboxylase] ligase